ncbi:competence protein ComEC [Microbacterium sp. cf046]|uniref:ComEC/Rec2 family competence protein n=1 Tax=Microbacterium sp. cf046 TaxID=1761803 RepID=UPI0008E4B519|nr:ComEC/Rec2 family competence protein [Microbacterium sp. cf046]SFS05582.1 competence protein ComEC [Microbacterium sp. cf046]
MTGVHATTGARAHLRLLPVAAAAWAVALAATMIPDAAAQAASALWAAALTSLAVIALQRGRRRPGRLGRNAGVLVVLALAAAAGAASHVALAQPARAEAERFGLGGGRAVVIEATVVGKIEQRATGEWVFDAVAHRIVTGSVSDAVNLDIAVRVQPSGVDRPDLLDVGASVEVAGTARAAPIGDRAVLTVSGSRGIRVAKGPEGIMAVAAELRRGLIASTEGLPAPGAGLIPGLAVGDTSAVSAQLDAAMKQSSLSHLTAVSGANCAIVVGLAFGAVALAGGSRRARVVAGALALAGFVLLVTPEPSVVRAGTMAGIAMLAVLLGRTGAGMAILCLAVTVLLVADPWLAGSLGFALSVVATASLLLFARPLAAGMARRMPRALALALSVPLAAQLACGPLLVIITPAVPVYGVAANLLAAPAAPVATIVGLAACITAPLPWVQYGLSAITWLPASWIAGTALTFSSLPGGQIPWLDGWVGAAALGVVSTAIGAVVIVPRMRSPDRRPGDSLRAPPRAQLLRGMSVVLLAAVAGSVAGGAALASVAGRLTVPADWSILACDVGQGDAVLIRSAGTVALVDTGPEPEVLRRCLDRVGVGRIDLLVLTHFDLDHIGGLDAILGDVTVALHGPVATREGAAALAVLESAGARTVDATAQMRGTLGDATWRVLWPPLESRAFPSGNDASVVVDVRGGGVPVSLFLGDMSASPQTALGASGALRPPYDVVKVAHHGSADQDAGLYELADPAVALVTVGAGNTYGHPRQETLDMLSELGATVVRTDAEGIVALWLEDSGLRVWREHERVGAPAG